MQLPSLKAVTKGLLRNKVYSLINIFGLALGLAAYLFILEYVSFEKSTNMFHKDIDRMYRLLNENTEQETWGEIEPGFAPLAMKINGVEDYCRFEIGISKSAVRRAEPGSVSFTEEKVGFVDGNFFSFFSFPVLQGNPDAMKQANTLFISDKTAKKYFASQSPVGQSLMVSNQFGERLYSVAGVFKSVANNDVNYDMVFSLETLRDPAIISENSWVKTDNYNSQYINTFFRLSPAADVKKVEKELNAIRAEKKEVKDGIIFRLQPFKYVHLPQSFSDYYNTTGNLRYTYMLALTGLLILLIAWFNYINLTTANALRRAAEVGVRKVIGATRTNLVLQFLLESVVINVTAFATAVGLVAWLQPRFNELTGKELSLTYLVNTGLSWWGIALLIAGALLSGAIAAWKISGYNPVITLKGRIQRTAGGILLRKSLVVGQFVISMALIMCTVSVYQQLQYMQRKSLTRNSSELLVFRGPQVGNDSSFAKRRTAFINAIKSEPGVTSVSQTGSIPGGGYNFKTEGFTQPGSVSGDEFKPYAFAIIDDNFLETYQLTLAAGRNFTQAETEVDWDDNSKVLLNESAVKSLGFTSNDAALATPVQWDERPLYVMGVVKDYHHTGLQQSIEPIIYYPQVTSSYITMRLATGDLGKRVANLQLLYKTFFPNNPVDYFFADEFFNRQYKQEQQYSGIFSIASGWAIIIACLGLFGLTTFSLQQRMRELGIRKVLGAGTPQIIKLIAGDFLKPLLLACIIALPVSWLALSEWLKNFAYRTTISPAVLLSSCALVVIVALLTVSAKTLQSAMANPVKSIRTE